MDALNDLLRVVICAVAAINTIWSRRGPRALARGDYNPPAFYLTFVFFTNLTFALYALRTLFGVEVDALALLLHVLELLTVGVALMGYRQGAALKASQFYSLYSALPQALAMAELVKRDPETAGRITDQIWEAVRQSAVAGKEHGA